MMNLQDWQTDALFDLSEVSFGALLSDYRYPWEILPDLPDLILKAAEGLDPAVYEKAGDQIWLARSVKGAEDAHIEGPCIIGEDCILRPGVYIRGALLTGRRCVLGHACEFKNALLLNEAEIPHFNYIGDSILGNRSHFGAGAAASNFRQDKAPVKIHLSATEYLDSGLPKMGAVVADDCEVGCNPVLNPGSLLGKRARVYPLSQSRIAVPADTILKPDQSMQPLADDTPAADVRTNPLRNPADKDA